MTDDSDRLWRVLQHPATRALTSAAVIAGFVIYAGKGSLTSGNMTRPSPSRT